jgi:hypothetical protein
MRWNKEEKKGQGIGKGGRRQMGEMYHHLPLHVQEILECMHELQIQLTTEELAEAQRDAGKSLEFA